MNKRLSDLLEGLTRFRQGEFTIKRELFEELAEKGQTPKVLFIGCCDSRYTPERILDTLPGMLFIHRNIGALVPPYESYTRTAGTDAAIEFAVKHLGIEHIIVCGHTHCGAVEAVMNIENIPADSALRLWLSYGQNAPIAAESRLSVQSGAPFDKSLLAEETEREFVRIALVNLLTYEFVREKVESGLLELHGWRFHIRSAELEVMQTETGEFHSAGIYVPEGEMAAEGATSGEEDFLPVEEISIDEPLKQIEMSDSAPAAEEKRIDATEEKTELSGQTESHLTFSEKPESIANPVENELREESGKSVSSEAGFKIPESLKKNAENVKTAFENWLRENLK